MITGAFKQNVGLQLLQWAVSQSDIWHLAHRCSELMHKFNEPNDKSAYVLDSFAAMDANNIECIDAFHLHCMHFDDEDSYIDNDQRNNYIHDEQRTNSTAPMATDTIAAATSAAVSQNQFPSQGNDNNPFQIEMNKE